MTFKLSNQLDYIGNPNLSFELYRSYIENNKHKFPDSVIKLISHSDWSGGSDSKAPYYSEVNSINLLNFGTSSAELIINLSKNTYVKEPFNIEVTYKGLLRFDIPKQDNISESPLIWRYEQFLYYDGYHSCKIKDKMFTHQIEWTDGNLWSITAREIEVKWTIS